MSDIMQEYQREGYSGNTTDVNKSDYCIQSVKVILASYWSRAYQVTVKKFDCLPSNAVLFIQRRLTSRQTKDCIAKKC